MEKARKWVMVPEESERTENNKSLSSHTISKEDLLKVIKLTNSGYVDNAGQLLENNKSVADVYECINRKSSAKNYNKFLEKLASPPHKKDAKIKKPKKEKVTVDKKDPWIWN